MIQKKLGELLVEAKAISQAQLDLALVMQQHWSLPGGAVR